MSSFGQPPSAGPNDLPGRMPIANPGVQLPGEDFDLTVEAPSMTLPPNLSEGLPTVSTSSHTAGAETTLRNKGPAIRPPIVTQKELSTLLEQATAKGVSDIHLRMGHRPKVRLHGMIQTLNMPFVSDKAIFDLMQRTIPFRALEKIDHLKEIDYGFELPGIARFRANLFYEHGRPAMVLRIVPIEIPEMNTLGLPEIIERFCHLENGLVLVAGPTGSGKTTTLAAMLKQINHTYNKHIITVEDPIEFTHQHGKSVVTQRELGCDTNNFATGVKYALRQDPDVILIGEIRDEETARAALMAAETGHLVFSTLHTSDAVQTLNRLVNIFDPQYRDPVRQQLSTCIRGTISMRLVTNTNQDGRIPVCEVMTATSTVKDYISRNQIDDIYELLQTTELGEMVSFNRSLFEAVKNGHITPEVAVSHSNNPVALSQRLKGVFHGTV